MTINIWYCKEMKLWRWTLADNSRPIINQESGQSFNLGDAMKDILNSVENLRMKSAK